MEPDAALARRAKAGDAQALDLLLQRHHAPLFAIARATAGNHHDALDLLQEACLRVMQSIGGLGDPELFYPWARSIVRNLALDGMRTRKRRQDKQALIAAREAALPRDTGQSERIYQAVIEAIGRLPDEHQAPLLCRYVEEASYAEIALRTGRTVDSIRGLLYRGTRLLRRELQRWIEQGEDVVS